MPSGHLPRVAIALGFVGAFGQAAAAADAATIEAAKKEGKVVWYTTNPIDPLVLQLTAAFETKYPGIKVEYARANSNEVALRIITEAKAGRLQGDVFDGTTTAEPLKAEGLALKWTPDAAKDFAPEYKDRDGYWVATNDYVITASFNTNLIKRGTEPRTWDDLLDPKYRGHIVWGAQASASAGPGFVGTVLKEMGQQRGLDYLKRLAPQKITSVNAASRVVIDQVIAGEYAIALQSFPENAIFSAKKGAPVQWIAMAPVMTGIVSTAGIIAGSPHPNAAKLLYEFMIDEEGQSIYRDTFYIPAHPKVAPLEAELTPGKHKVAHLTPTETAEAMPRWLDIYKELFQ
jgi:ABC-type Fe3+ transport system substrate-binding protein